VAVQVTEILMTAIGSGDDRALRHGPRTGGRIAARGRAARPSVIHAPSLVGYSIR
jgi:hypothetical protein